jgi:hypothetical protein
MHAIHATRAKNALRGFHRVDFLEYAKKRFAEWKGNGMIRTSRVRSRPAAQYGPAVWSGGMGVRLSTAAPAAERPATSDVPGKAEGSYAIGPDFSDFFERTDPGKLPDGRCSVMKRSVGFDLSTPALRLHDLRCALALQ